MNLRAFKALADAGATWAEIARETGHDWRTVKRYLSSDANLSPPVPAKRGPGRRKLDPYAHLVDAWLAKQPRLRATVIYERLVAEHGFAGHYQRVKVYVRENRERLVGAGADPVGLHRRFEVLPGAQAQVDWGDEGEIQTQAGPLHVYSFHLTLSYSRDPFCCYTAAQDLATFWDCHRRAFAHVGGVPATIVYDRTKTVVRRHVGRGQATPLHPEAVAFAAHYGFAIWLAAPGRPQTKGRVERQVELVRSHVLCGRVFASLAEMDAAFAAWLPIRRAQVHRTHGEVIAVRAERDRAALAPLPERPYVVCERHTRRVGRDALVSFQASQYSVPWRTVRPGGRVELRITPAEVTIFSLGGQQRLLATHPRAAGRGSWVVDPTHWDGLPDRVEAQPLPPCAGDCELAAAPEAEPGQLELPGITGWASSPAARVPVAQRRLAVYDQLAGVRS
ncbi:MAG TPA: IS21 family transposase [Actinomycetes bacterium]|nr:IS21 family transposase [Actinomycetes bacterium]